MNHSHSTRPAPNESTDIRVVVQQAEELLETSPIRRDRPTRFLGMLTAVGVSAGCWTYLTVTLARFLR